MRPLYPGTPPVDEPEAWATLRSIAAQGSVREVVIRSGLLENASDAAQGLLDLYLPLLEGPRAHRPWVIAHLGQSLDGRIALPDGRSKWITGEADLDHTHRLRALCDAVLVGANTIACDDPKLTVRRVEGENPLRVVLDPRRRLPASHTLFQDEVAPTLVLTATPGPDRLGHAQVVQLPAEEGIICADSVLQALHARGIRRLLIEGGGVTVSRFLQARRVDRLQLVIAPLLLGAGRPALQAPLGADLASLPRPATRLIRLGDDWLFDCDLGAPP